MMLTNDDVAQPVARESVALVWTLVTRSVGLTAGVGIALLAVAALLSIP
jgi:hypothetical protein